ncbi:MAG: hypothetical protein K6G84_10505 [Lachnospiraceae bacterium]|nr:hypothetical protein [Lachnospiraceae bacterium]
MKNILTNLLIVIGIAALLAGGGYACLMYLNEWNKDSFPSAEENTAAVSTVPDNIQSLLATEDGDVLLPSENSEDVEVSEESESSKDADSSDDAEKSEESEESESSEESEIPEGLDKHIESEYDAPSEKDIKVPDAGDGKSGLEDIAAEEETISDEEADKLEDELSYGATGDDFDFDATYYPYYQMLNGKSQNLYRQMYANALEQNTVFKSIENNINRNELNNAFEALICDHPSIYWIVTGYSARFRPKGNCIEINFEYNSTANNFTASDKNFHDAASEILDKVNNASSDYDKEKAAHYAISEKNLYNLRAPLNQSAYSALVNGETVCAGYARAFQYIMQNAGIPCYYCEGYAGEAHAWNIIKLDDEYYNVDVTWDDIDGDKVCNYEFFNKTDNDFRKDHKRTDLSVYLPPCNGEKYRNLEPEDTEDEKTSDNNTSSLSNYGLSENDIIRDLDTYYKDCYDQILSKGAGTYHIYSAIEGQNAFNIWNEAYKNNLVRDKVLSPVMENFPDATKANISVTAEQIGENRYILDHTITIE